MTEEKILWAGKPTYAQGESGVPPGYVLRDMGSEARWTVADEEKTLGQIAAGVFYPALQVTGQSVNKQTLEDAWEAAAWAVFKEMRRRYNARPELRDSWLDEVYKRSTELPLTK